MGKIAKFRKSTEAEPFTFRQAIEFGITRRELQAWLDCNEVERLERGLYGWVDNDRTDETQFIEANSIVGSPSAIGLLSALSYHGLSDIIPTKVWVIVPMNKRSSRSSLRLFRQRHPNWDIGIEKNKGFWITNIDRTLVESIAYKDAVIRQESIQALRRALKDKKTSLERILKMARNLGMERRIRPYLEALA